MRNKQHPTRTAVACFVISPKLSLCLVDIPYISYTKYQRGLLRWEKRGVTVPELPFPGDTLCIFNELTTYFRFT